MQILAISGSLRAVSSNTSLLQAVAALAPESVNIVLYGGLVDLPHFNPDREGVDEPESLIKYRALLKSADGVLFSSPEYAHGVPGVLKNALDWVVGTGEFVGKPVALLNASPRSTHAQASLTETLRIMTATIVEAASIAVPPPGRKLDTAGIVADPEISALLRSALNALIQTIAAQSSTSTTDL